MPRSAGRRPPALGFFSWPHDFGTYLALHNTAGTSREGVARAEGGVIYLGHREQLRFEFEASLLVRRLPFGWMDAPRLSWLPPQYANRDLTFGQGGFDVAAVAGREIDLALVAAIVPLVHQVVPGSGTA